MEGKFQKLIQRTKEVATTYTGTFVVVMFLNQLLFFGFCLNPICIIAAMPHVLFITVVIGTWLEKDKILSNLDDVKEVNSPEAVESAEAVDAHNFIERLAEIRRFEEAKSLEETKRLQELTRLSSLDDKTMYFNSFSEAHTYASKTSGMIVRRNPDGVGFIAYRE